ncbi:MAG: ABC transporter substrate-binding protein, partial [Nitrospinota bacterium]
MTFRISRFFTMAAAGALLLSACATPVKPTKEAEVITPPQAVIVEKDTTALDEMLEKAKQAAEEFDLQKELSIRREIVKQFKDNEKSAESYYWLGQHYLNLRYYKPALKSFKKVADSFPGSRYYVDSLIGIGISRVYLKEYGKAGATLRKALKTAESEEQRSKLLYHLGENYYLQDRYSDAVEQFMACRKIPGSFRNQAERRISRIFHNFLSEGELLEFADRYKTDYPADIALVELSEIYRRNGDTRRFVEIKKRLEEDFPAITIAEEVMPYQESVEPPEAITIGSILPLSGKDAAIGAQALQGIQLAFSLNNDRVEQLGIRLMIKDSASDPNVSRAAATELAGDTSVLGIIGPFTNRTAESVIEPLTEYPLPLFTPADNPAIDSAISMGLPFYQIGVTAATQGRVLAELAVNRLGVRRVAIIYQNDEFGEKVTGSFADTAYSLNADVVALESYEPDSTDFGEQIRAIGGRRDSEIREFIFKIVTEEEERTPEEINEILEILYQNDLSIPYISKYKELPLTANNFSLGLKMSYDAVLVPADGERAGLILPELAFYNVSGVQILGSSRYASGELIRLGGRHTEGVVFPAEFFPGIGGEQVANFITEFEDAFGTKPDINAARAYDAVNLLLTLMEKGNQTRPLLTEAMNVLDVFKGVSGVLHSEGFGILTKTPVLLTVKDLKIIEY